MAKKVSDSKKTTLKTAVKAVTKAVSKVVEKAVTKASSKATAKLTKVSTNSVVDKKKKESLNSKPTKEVTAKVKTTKELPKIEKLNLKEKESKAVSKKTTVVKVQAKKEQAKVKDGKAKKNKITQDEDEEVASKAKLSSKNPLSKHAPRVAVRSSAEKPSLMSKKNKNVEDEHGDLLIEKAREEMASINEGVRQAEKAAKVKPIKVERGNLSDEKAKWAELNKRHGKEKAETYKMSDSYEPLKPIVHKVLGWGFILTNENNRLEVLFENGIKMLISNYKPN